jgi:CRP/FNR family transcriptional regulator
MMKGALGKVYANGEYIIRQGDKGDCMYVVQAGTLEVTREEHGKEVRIGVMKSGDIFGEMAIFEHEMRSATVRALGDARVLTVDKRTFLGRIQDDPALAFNLVKIMSGRIRMLTGELARARVATSPAAFLGDASKRLQGRERRAGGDRRLGIERRAAFSTKRAS